MSSLVPENAVPDYSELNEADRPVLDDSHSFFSCVFRPFYPIWSSNPPRFTRKRYNIVGRVVVHPIKVEEMSVSTNL
jgi:hypothetical protein